MGKTKPDNRNDGWIKKKFVIMACCCVADTVEIKRPIPSVLMRNRQLARKNSKTLPFIGNSNHQTAKTVMRTICAREIRIEGNRLSHVNS